MRGGRAIGGIAVVVVTVLAARGASGTEEPSSTAAVVQATAVEDRRVDLNRASVEELTALPGIGRKRAEAIVAWRQRVPFTRPTQLLNIKGIGKRTLHKLRPLVRVGSTPLITPSEAKARPRPARASAEVSGMRPPAGCPPALPSSSAPR